MIFTNWHNIWESVKTPLRQMLLFLYAFLIGKVFDFLSTKVGFTFTDDQKIQILGFGTPIVWALLSFLDNFLHRVGKFEETTGQSSPLTGGIARF